MKLQPRYKQLPENVRAIFVLLQETEWEIKQYMTRLPAPRPVSDARLEMLERIRHMHHCLYKVATNCLLTDQIPLPTDDQNTELTDPEELRFYLEGFYYSAWRIHRIMSYLTNQNIKFDGVCLVRNKLIEHCSDGELKATPLFMNSLSFGTAAGPKLKPAFCVGGKMLDNQHKDKGLYENASNFLKTLKERLQKL